ncbi:MAG: hypothetical protein NTV54_01510 [Ignavibacteriales bacterium]|nr:hypothetical protein [Ignavibacteriales bacterium]
MSVNAGWFCRIDLLYLSMPPDGKSKRHEYHRNERNPHNAWMNASHLVYEAMAKDQNHQPQNDWNIEIPEKLAVACDAKKHTAMLAFQEPKKGLEESNALRSQDIPHEGRCRLTT